MGRGWSWQQVAAAAEERVGSTVGAQEGKAVEGEKWLVGVSGVLEWWLELGAAKKQQGLVRRRRGTQVGPTDDVLVGQ